MKHVSEKDIKSIQARGMAPDDVMMQLDRFKAGFPPIILDRPAIVGDGIRQLDQNALSALAALYEEHPGAKQVEKFVPASGAATRMFKDLFAWREALQQGFDPEELLSHDKDAALFFDRLSDFAFWDDLVLYMCREDLVAEHFLVNKNLLPLLDFILEDHGLDYAFLPKGLILFHRYDDHCRTAMEEHLVEGANYAAGTNRRVSIHFTVSPDHMDYFKSVFRRTGDAYEEKLGVRFDISYSVQKPSTDTIAVDHDNVPFRERDGSLVFRPGGHGALIENLQELDADLVFIKNIDNVVPDHLKEQTIIYKKALAGLLLKIQKQVHRWLHILDEEKLSDKDFGELSAFAVKDLGFDASSIGENNPAGLQSLRSLLNRPIRVCGMVRNEGEPGGGPFWVKDPDSGALSLQIVETSQVNMDDQKQKEILSQSTHFNPVDLVVAIRDYKGNRFNLREFIDPQTGFISHKSKDGKTLKALELPGLWNGAMAKWISVFVEVPIVTFNPVKVVNDLLRAEHQPA